MAPAARRVAPQFTSCAHASTELASSPSLSSQKNAHLKSKGARESRNERKEERAQRGRRTDRVVEHRARRACTDVSHTRVHRPLPISLSRPQRLYRTRTRGSLWPRMHREGARIGAAAAVAGERGVAGARQQRPFGASSSDRLLAHTHAASAAVSSHEKNDSARLPSAHHHHHASSSSSSQAHVLNKRQQQGEQHCHLSLSQRPSRRHRTALARPHLCSWLVRMNGPARAPSCAALQTGPGLRTNDEAVLWPHSIRALSSSAHCSRAVSLTHS